MRTIGTISLLILVLSCAPKEAEISVLQGVLIGRCIVTKQDVRVGRVEVPGETGTRQYVSIAIKENDDRYVLRAGSVVSITRVMEFTSFESSGVRLRATIDGRKEEIDVSALFDPRWRYALYASISDEREPPQPEDALNSEFAEWCP